MKRKRYPEEKIISILKEQERKGVGDKCKSLSIVTDPLNSDPLNSPP